MDDNMNANMKMKALRKEMPRYDDQTEGPQSPYLGGLAQACNAARQATLSERVEILESRFERLAELFQITDRSAIEQRVSRLEQKV